MIERIYSNRDKIDSGRPLGVKWTFTKLSKIIAGFLKATYLIITGNTGSGKTKFTKYLVLSAVREHKKKYPNSNIRVNWFALEESSEYFYLSILAHLLYEKFKLSLSVAELLSYKENKDLKSYFPLIEECREELEYLKSFIVCYDYISNPFGIYKEVRNYMWTIGKDITVEDKEGNKIPIGFEYNNEDDFVINVFDHFTLVSIEEGKTEWNNLAYFSKEYILNGLTKRYKCANVLIQQQASETERVEFWQGEAVANKLKPTLNGLGVYKNSQQDATMVLGITNFARYGVKKYDKFDITHYGHEFRLINVLKDRLFGTDGTEIGMLFDGASNQFSEI
jgi:hypothetical protein